MAYVLLDDFSPILAVRRVGNADAIAVAEMLAWVDLHLESGGRRHALVYDAGDNPDGQPDAKARQVGGEWLRRNRARLPRACVGIDFAFASSLSRGAMTAVFWIAQPPVPYTFHATSRAAVEQAVQRAGMQGRIDPREVVAGLDELARSPSP